MFNTQDDALAQSGGEPEIALMPIALYLLASIAAPCERMVVASPLKSLRSVGSSVESSTSMQSNSPVNGTSGARGMLPEFSWPFAPGMVAFGRDDRPLSTDHEIGWRLVSVSRKSVSCQPCTQRPPVGQTV